MCDTQGIALCVSGLHFTLHVRYLSVWNGAKSALGSRHDGLRNE